MNRLLTTALALSLAASTALSTGFVGSALAGPVADFEAAYDGAYASYRTALFATNSGDAAKSVGALTQLDAGWAALMAQYRASPPPQYEADPMWDASAQEVTDHVEAAKAQVAAGELPKAHETLEGIREVLGSLHARNGVETFSDRMNAYHAEMEVILGMDASAMDAAAKQSLLEHAAVLAYLAKDALDAPPAAAAGNAEYEALAKAVQGSVDQFLTAARSGDEAALKAALGGLKVPYSKLFLKFG